MPTPEPKVFGGLFFQHVRTDQWATYWERGLLGVMQHARNSRYRFYTTEVDVEGNPVCSWEYEDPNESLTRAIEYFKDLRVKIDETIGVI